MAWIIELDSAYVGFIFLVVAELVLLPLIMVAHTRSLETELKRRLDEGDPVRLHMKSVGPLQMNPHLGWKKVTVLMLPAALALLLVWVAELGISGRTIDSSSTRPTFLAGGYFKLDIMYTGDFLPTPYNFAAIWPSCVEYGDNSIAGHVALVPYEQTGEEEWEFGAASCEDNPEVLVTSMECSEQNSDTETNTYFGFTVTGVGSVVYSDGYRRTVQSSSVGMTNITVGDAVVDSCDGIDGGPGIILWVEADNVDGPMAIIDDSYRVGGAYERWLVAGSTTFAKEVGDYNTGTAVFVECMSGCLEAIVEWMLITGGSSLMGIEQAGTFMEIWYEGLNWYDGYDWNDNLRTPLSCDDVEEYTSWLVDGLFNAGDCTEAVAPRSIPDGGTLNVTRVSWWALAALIVGFALAIAYRLHSREKGYNLTSYEGLAEAYFTEVNPASSWKKGDGLEVSLSKDGVSNRVRARLPPSFSSLHEATPPFDDTVTSNGPHAM